MQTSDCKRKRDAEDSKAPQKRVRIVQNTGEFSYAGCRRSTHAVLAVSEAIAGFAVPSSSSSSTPLQEAVLFGTFFSTLPTPSNLFFTKCRKSIIIILVTGAGGILVIQMDPKASKVEGPPTLLAERIDVHVQIEITSEENWRPSYVMAM
jgi:hypothetical protein